MLAVIIFLGFGLESAHADYANSISIQKINVQPSTLKVGDKFAVTATLVNNSTTPIGLEGGTCSIKVLTVPFFTVSFDSHAKIKTQNLTCAGVDLGTILKPGEKLSGTSPDFTSTYVAIESGTANATITFAYNVINQTDSTQPNIEQKISKSILFTIYDNNSIPMNDLHSHPVPFLASPLQQFKSGIKPEYVKCSQDLHLILKAEDDSFACVKIETAKDLVKRGWATTFGTGISTNDYYTKCDTLYPQSNTGVAVFYMPANSIGKICVRYHNLNNTPTGIGMRIFEANNFTQNASNVTSWMDSSTLEGNANKTIVYFIKTGTNAGFYGMSINCGGFPLAVGYDANSTITASDFPWIGRAFHCGVITYDSHIEGTTGIGVKYISYP